MKHYNTGFVLGKFCPLHRGHMLLIQRALDASDIVYVVVDNIMDDVIPVERRIKWVKQQYPSAIVLTQNHPLPQDPSETPRFWDIWREELLRLLPRPVDAVFASEQYGARLAKELSGVVPTCQFVGWDFAYTDDGWVVVEGNSKAQFICFQTASQKGYREKLEKMIGMSLKKFCRQQAS